MSSTLSAGGAAAAGSGSADVETGTSGRDARRIRRLVLVVPGTRSDVLPYAALGLALQHTAGFHITLMSHGVHARMVAALGLHFVPLKGNPHAVLASAAFRDAVAAESSLKIGVIVRDATLAVLADNMSTILRVCSEADGILSNIAALTECASIAQKFQIPCILCPLAPFSPSGEIPAPTLMPPTSKYSWLNKVTYELSGMLLWNAFGSTYNRFRVEQLHIGPQRTFVLEGVAQVTGFNNCVVPRPPEWGSYIRMNGCWQLPASLQTSIVNMTNPLLARFTAQPPADPRLRPIYIGFECIPVSEPASLIRLMHSLSSKYGVPFIFAAGSTDIDATKTSALLEGVDGIVWESDATLDTLGGTFAMDGSFTRTHGAGVASSATTTSVVTAGGRTMSAAAFVDAFPLSSIRVLVIREAPLPWLLPRCAMAIHQGGADVMQAAVAAGIPSAAFPAFGEQFFWASRVCALSVGPVLYYSIYQVLEKLDEIIFACRLPHIGTQAARLGATIRGLGSASQAAVLMIRDMLSRPQHRHCGITCEWAPDSSSDTCTVCRNAFTLTNRRRHCRSCGRLACYECLTQRCHLPGYPETAPQIVCEPCLTHRRNFFAVHAGFDPLPRLTVAEASAGAGGSEAWPGTLGNVTDVPLAPRGDARAVAPTAQASVGVTARAAATAAAAAAAADGTRTEGVLNVSLHVPPYLSSANAFDSPVPTPITSVAPPPPPAGVL